MSALYAVAVTAGRDRNGNTRRAIVIYDGGDVVAVMDGDGAEDVQMLGNYRSLTTRDAVNTDSPLKITPAYYRELIAGKHTMTRRGGDSE